ncbi:RNA exonuclease ngl2 [Basidiobolus ranarum]|uniref:RNA exonuclease ngl2 n=1 Tax=Basidiobolus ranarum TaxID=34480 RepID=A0ABR2VZ76_9FUNG
MVRTWTPTLSQTFSKEGLKFTILTYNVLAQCLIKRTLFPYATKKALRWGHRKTNILNEILSLSPDIVCLQELDKYEEFFGPELKNAGYDGRYHQKEGNSEKDGCAILWKKDKFSHVNHYKILYDRDEITSGDESYSQINTQAQGSVENAEQQAANDIPVVRPETLLRTRNIGLVVALKANSEEKGEYGLTITSSHLYWRPYADSIRMRQALHLKKVVHKFNAQYNFPVLLCGDFNFQPNSAPYLTVTGQPLSSELKLRLDPYRFEKWEPSETPSNEELAKLKLETRLKEVYVGEDQPKGELLMEQTIKYPSWESIYSLFTEHHPQPVNKEPGYTNFTSFFQATLDYIFRLKDDAFERVVPHRVLAIPPPEDLTHETALPSETISSDHICIMAECSLFPSA